MGQDSLKRPKQMIMEPKFSRCKYSLILQNTKQVQATSENLSRKNCEMNLRENEFTARVTKVLAHSLHNT